MRITDVRIRKINKEGRMKAIVSVTFDEAFVVHDIKVIEKDEGIFIAMPSRKTSDGEFRLSLIHIFFGCGLCFPDTSRLYLY